ncbi:hypothetical protein ACIQNI_08855 [Streptomyces sp. NPDC091266]|uniref:hypothetical protein n=1 Tax=Streptomyces sp. NPDC091266 TaxID=3365978 RepID=UPI003800FBBA
MSRTAHARYHVGHNKIGQAPEYRVECIGDIEFAREWLDTDVSNTAENYEGDKAQPFLTFLELVDLTREDAGTLRIGERHAIGDMEFWITPVECHCRCECERGADCDDPKHNREAPTVADIEFFPVVVTDVPADEDHAPLLVDPVHARLVQADGIAEGDTMLAGVPDKGQRVLARTYYFNDQYEAHPAPYDQTCPCGVCVYLADEPGPVVNVSTDNPWETCDPWPAREIALIFPAERLT